MQKFRGGSAEHCVIDASLCVRAFALPFFLAVDPGVRRAPFGDSKCRAGPSEASATRLLCFSVFQFSGFRLVGPNPNFSTFGTLIR